jgi:oligopeptidase B
LRYKQKKMLAPIAQKQPKEIVTHAHSRIDNYYWLNDREDAEVIRYLEAENAYTDAVLAHTKDFQNQLFEEMKGRIKEDDNAVPYRIGSYWYYSRYEKGMEYPLYCRTRIKPQNFADLSAVEDEAIILNVNELAKDYEYFSIGDLVVSPNEKLLAYSFDTVSRRIYEIRFKNLETGEMLANVITETSGEVVWADDQTVFYVKKDLETLRDFQVFCHKLHKTAAQNEGDLLKYEEKDETFYLTIRKSRTKEYIFIHATSTQTDEVLYLALSYIEGNFVVLQPRIKDLKYEAEHFGNLFLIRTNWQAENYRIVKTLIWDTTKPFWKDVVAHDKDVFIEDFEVFKEFLVWEQRRNGLIEICVRKWGHDETEIVNFGEPAYLAYLETNTELNVKTFRVGYTSLTTPTTVFEYDMSTKYKKILKKQEVLGNFDQSNYKTERVWATASDGTKIPISLVYHKETQLDGTAPLLQYGYGSYGISIDASFSSVRLSLLDRGFIFAIAHIRGGQELGRNWYENGKLLQKINTFTDFIAVSEHLIANKYTSKQKLFAYGGSAGGLLMGAVANLRPDLYAGMLAAVPFVDCVTTMLDDTIPLTTFEYDEWGNPNEKKSYDYMLSYSPYDNVKAQNYPNMLITTGLHDSQVQYWEPAKWVAKLRTLKTDNNLLLLYTDMTAGHGGASGRFNRLHEIALEYAFMLELSKINK